MMDAQPVQPGRLDRRQSEAPPNSVTRSGSVGCCSVLVLWFEWLLEWNRMSIGCSARSR
jgi:hypothetical protein